MATYTKKVCDRCGEEIKPKMFPFLQISTHSKLGYGDFDYTDCKYDLCSLCCKSFNAWMKEKKRSETDNAN